MGYRTEYDSIDEYCEGESGEILYINTHETTPTILEILTLSKLHFGDKFNLRDYTIFSTHNQFRCHGYDLYDGNDYAYLTCVCKKEDV